ncbi:MAG: hypothetical protein COB35_04850 [Gammaproteobacteria bacterium]|nr:MAG: hypothetical protein COB35_04850 [Gammaproteobacteria bacterium]
MSDVDYACIRAGSTKKPPKYHQMLVGLVSDAFGVEAIYHVQNFFGIKTDIEFIGIVPQPEIAIYAYEVLHRQLTWDRSNYIKTLKRYKRANKTRKADLFAEAWVQAVWINISTYEQSKGHKELITRFKNNRHNNLSKMKARDHKIKSNDDDALTKGAKAGSKANLHHGMNGQELKKLEAASRCSMKY